MILILILSPIFVVGRCSNLLFVEVLDGLHGILDIVVISSIILTQVLQQDLADQRQKKLARQD